MNSIDIALIIILVFQLLFAIKNGVVHELLKCIITVLCIGAAYLITPMLTSKITGIFNVSGMEQYIKGAFLICFIVLSVSTMFTSKIITLLAGIFSKIVNKTSVSRVLGAFLSVLRTCAFCGALLILVPMIMPSHNLSDEINSSVVAKVPVKMYSTFYDFIAKFIDQEGITLDTVKKGINI